MKRAVLLLSLLFPAACATTSAPDSTVPAVSAPRVSMQTNAGTLTLELFPDSAPKTVEQFVKLVRAGVYDGAYFYRLDRGFVLQTSEPQTERATPLTAEQRALIHPLALEAMTLVHRRGVLSLAHRDDPNSGETSFSILLGDAPHLDGKYTIFGMLQGSEEVLEQIEQRFDSHARDPNGQRLQIVKMTVLD